MKYTIGLDIGTTNVKGILLSENSEIAAKASAKFHYDSPEAGYVQIQADAFADNCFGVIAELTKALPQNGVITGISQVSASGNLLLLDENNRPLTPIYNWQDARVTNEVEQVLGKDFDYKAFYEKIGWPLGPTFPLAELCYLKCHEPQLLARAAKVCMSTEYLNYLLTGKFGISPSAGTPFYLIDQITGTYDAEVLRILGITEEMLPVIMKAGEVLGAVTADACERYGISAGAAVYCGTFDHPGGAIATGVTEEGTALLSCGTSWVAFMPIRNRDVIIRNGFLCDPFLSDRNGPWGAMCSIPSIGNTVGELVERYIGGGKDKYRQLDAYAMASQNGAGGLTIDPSDLQNKVIATYPKENIAYAILEMPARLLKERMDIFLQSGVQFERIYMAGGPTKSPIWVSITEKMIGLPVVISEAEYSGAVGAAMLAKNNARGREA